MEELLYLVGVAVALSVGWLAYRRYRGSALLYRWAQDNGYKILQRQYRWFLRGPFWWALGSNYAVYYVTVADRKGKKKSGWICFGGWFWGLASDTVDVRWEEQ